MILLPQQFQALVYHFLAGWVFALTWSGMNRMTWHFRRSPVRWIAETIYFCVFVTAMYAGLIPITGGQTRVVLMLGFAVGVGVYLKFYAMTFSPLFERGVGHLASLFGYIRHRVHQASKCRQYRRSQRRNRRRQRKECRGRKRNRKTGKDGAG